MRTQPGTMSLHCTSPCPIQLPPNPARVTPRCGTCGAQALSQQLSGSVGLYAQLEAEREATAAAAAQAAQLDQLRADQAALIASLELQASRLREEAAYEAGLRAKLAEQLAAANEVWERLHFVCTLYTFVFERCLAG